MSAFLSLALQLAVIAYAFVGGVFLAFSDFIMRSLAQAPGDGGAETMQVINREVFRWLFMTLFLGMAPISLAIAGYGVFVGGGPGALLVLAGLTYTIGCFGVTVFFNVPMNEALAGMDASTEAARGYWTGTYLPRWTFWNTVRTIACATALALLMTGLLWLTEAQAA